MKMKSSNIPTTKIIFDNHDSRIKYYQLLLERDLNNIDHYSLPSGFHFSFYKDGDMDAWIEIEKSAKEFTTYEQGLEAWRKFFSQHEQVLGKRMLFVETDDSNRKVATATAYIDITGRDTSGAGWLHWVAVHRDFQGRGLSKPLICKALETMVELGYTMAKIPTQTTTWLACRIYLDFGFRPIAKNAVNSRDGWRIIRALTNHPALSDFDPATDEEIVSGGSIT